MHENVEATKLKQRTVVDPEEEANLLASMAKMGKQKPKIDIFKARSPAADDANYEDKILEKEAFV